MEDIRKKIIIIKDEPVVMDIKVIVCGECNNVLCELASEKENTERAKEIYRRRHRILTPKRIKKIREKYHLTQTSFSRLLGFNEKTISRYEAGAIPNESASNLLLLAENKENFMMLYSHNKSKISYQEQVRFENTLKDMDLKALEEGLFEDKG